MKVVVILGSPRRGHTHALVERIAAALGVDVTLELVRLSELDLQPCRGCYACQSRGEGLCPLKDDLLATVERMKAADGVIFASPTYTANVSGLMKAFMDRLAWTAHRPPFLGKPAMLVSTASADASGALRALRWFRYPGFEIVAELAESAWPSPRIEWRRGASDELRLRRAALRFRHAMQHPTRELSLAQVLRFNMMKITAVTDPWFFRADTAYHESIDALGFHVPAWKKRIGEAVFLVGARWLASRTGPRPRR